MSKKFSFTYLPYPSKDLKSGEIVDVFRPTIPVQISYKRSLSWPFQALVDSGSDRNLFPSKLGEIIGIDIRKGDKRPIEGIGKHLIETFTHKVLLTINNTNFDIEADFSYEQ